MGKHRKDKNTIDKKQQSKNVVFVSKVYTVHNKAKNVFKHKTGILFKLKSNNCIPMSDYTRKVTITTKKQLKVVCNELRGLIQIEHIFSQTQKTTNAIVHSIHTDSISYWDLNCMNVVGTVSLSNIQSIICVASKSLYLFAI